MLQKRPNTLAFFLLATLLVLAVAAVRRSESLPPPENGLPNDPFADLLAKNESQSAPEPDNDNADPSEPASTEANFNAAASIVVDGLPSVHLLRAPFDAHRSAMAWTNYLAALDIERMYFTQEDLAALERHRLRIADEAHFGSLAFAEEAHALFMSRVRERVAAIQKALAANDFDFTVDEEYAWRRRDAPWPKDAAEQDDLWRRRLKNEVLSRIIAAEAAEEEKAKTEAGEGGSLSLPTSTLPRLFVVAGPGGSAVSAFAGVSGAGAEISASSFLESASLRPHDDKLAAAKSAAATQAKWQILGIVRLISPPV